MKNKLQKVGLVILVGVLGVVSCEVAMRLLNLGDKPSHEYLIPPVPGLLYAFRPYHHWSGVFHDRIVRRVKQPDGSNQFIYEDKTVSYNTNRWGVRGTEDFDLASLRDKNVILCVGDSTTFGSNVNDKDTYARQLQQILRQRGMSNAVVVNAGVTAYNIWDYKATVAYWLPRFKPKVVVVGIFMNDLEPWTWYDWVRAYVSPHSYFFFNVFQLGHLVYLHWPKDSSSEWTSVLTETLDRDSQLAVLRYARMKSHPQCIADYIRQMNKPDQWRMALKNADEMKALCDRQGARLICLIIPLEFQTMFGYRHPEPQATIARYLAAHGIEYCDIRPLFTEVYRRKHSLYPICELVHFNARGHQIIAQELANRIGKAPDDPGQNGPK